MRSRSRERVRKISDNKPSPDPQTHYCGYDSRKKCNSKTQEHCFSVSSDCLQYTTVTIQYLVLLELDVNDPLLVATYHHYGSQPNVAMGKSATLGNLNVNR